MKRSAFTILFILLPALLINLQAQRVAVVFSGGGSKGSAHIGVLRALEEADIPIDFIAGTSIGAVIGGLYAIGYSPDEIEELVCSKEFQQWADGVVDDRYVFYFKQHPPDASWINIKFNYDSVFRYKLPSNLVSPFLLDYAFMEIFAPANVACNNNFDSLFVPFRCVASDISSNSQVVFRNGDVSDAIRASMSYPFYFKPIRINGKLLFDGGMYNNFPSDIALNDFNPDIIIGCSVTQNSDPPEDDDILNQVENMLMSKTNYSVVCDNSIMLEPFVHRLGLTNFSKAKANIDSGYIETKRHLDEIREFVIRRSNKATRDSLRKAFNLKKPPLMVDEIKYKGLNKQQKIYISKLLMRKRPQTPLSKIKPEYFKLLADDNIEHIYPKATFNSQTGFYDMVLDVKRDKNIIGLFGGNVSSSPINEAFIELQYKYFGRSAFNISANSYFGRFYSSVQLRGRFDVPARLPFYFESFFNMGQWDFFQSSTTFFEDKKKSYLIQNENFWNFNAGLPIGNKARFETGVTLAHLRDDYYQTNLFSRYDTTDRTYFDMVTPYLLFERNTLNRKNYPNQGSYLLTEVRYINGLERYFPGSTSVNNDYYEMPHDWYQVRLKFEHYFKMKFFRSGVYMEAFFSDPGFFTNYTSSALMAPAFQPIPESKTLFMPNYRAYTYGAFGLKNIFVLFKRLDFRLEAYVFQPYRELHEYQDFSPWLGEPFSKRHFIASTALVYNSPLGPVSLSINYYTADEQEFSFIFNLGYILFNRRAKE